MNRTFIFDTETTGLVDNTVMNQKHQPHIIELYGNVVNEAGDVIDEIEFLCNPGMKLPRIITKITGLKDADLIMQPPFKKNAEAVKAIIESCDSVVAHNLSYDYSLVEFEMGRCGMKVEWPAIRICTVEETEWFKGHRLKLADLHEYLFNEPFPDAHRARNDVAALTRCFNELRKRGDV